MHKKQEDDKTIFLFFLCQEEIVVNTLLNKIGSLEKSRLPTKNKERETGLERNHDAQTRMKGGFLHILFAM